MASDHIDPRLRPVLYIKLGDGGRWCDACIKHGVLKLGFWTGEADMHAACNSRDWDSVRALLRKKRGKTDQDSVEDDFRQVAAVFGDDGTTTRSSGCCVASNLPWTPSSKTSSSNTTASRP